MTERPKKADDPHLAHQQLLRMLHNGFLKPEEFAEAELRLKQVLKAPNEQIKS